LGLSAGVVVEAAERICGQFRETALMGIHGTIRSGERSGARALKGVSNGTRITALADRHSDSYHSADLAVRRAELTRFEWLARSRTRTGSRSQEKPLLSGGDVREKTAENMRLEGRTTETSPRNRHHARCYRVACVPRRPSCQPSRWPERVVCCSLLNAFANDEPHKCQSYCDLESLFYQTIGHKIESYA
jgi:hypothetical protein